jgi:hypothetical protein
MSTCLEYAHIVTVQQTLELVTPSMSRVIVDQLCHHALSGTMASSNLLQSISRMDVLRCLSTGDCQRGGVRKLTKTTAGHSGFAERARIPSTDGVRTFTLIA